MAAPIPDSQALRVGGTTRFYIAGSERGTPRACATLNAIMAEACSRLGGRGTVHFNAGEALYPDDADSAKLLLEIAERRAEQRGTAETESILALGAITSELDADKTVHPLSSL